MRRGWRGLSKRLMALEADLFALSEDAMSISEMDGFVAGLIVCPDLISPREWLPLVWGGETLADGPVFESLDDLNAIISRLTAHYNAVANILHDHPGKYNPIYDVDEETGELNWEGWADGFTRAINLRPDAWSELLQADDDYTTALMVLATLGAIAPSELPLQGDEVDALTADAVDIIPDLVEQLNAWRLIHQPIKQPTPPPSRASSKIGRNDPCPCGSGEEIQKVLRSDVTTAF